MTARHLLAIVWLAGCNDSASHIFAGRLYEAARGCVDPTTSIDVVEGPSPTAPCERACFVAPADGDVGATYVSTMCAPFPRGFDTSGSGAQCAAALTAYDRADTCLADGGSLHPPLADAGRD